MSSNEGMQDEIPPFCSLPTNVIADILLLAQPTPVDPAKLVAPICKRFVVAQQAAVLSVVRDFLAKEAMKELLGECGFPTEGWTEKNATVFFPLLYNFISCSKMALNEDTQKKLPRCAHDFVTDQNLLRGFLERVILQNIVVVSARFVMGTEEYDDFTKLLQLPTWAEDKEEIDRRLALAKEEMEKTEKLDFTPEKIAFSFFPSALVRLFPNLKILNVSGKRLSHLPSNLGDFSALEVLEASDNRIVVIPGTIQQCTELRELCLASNCLIGVAPEVGLLEKLQVCNFDSNRITELPDEICNAKGIETLSVSKNRLSALPERIGGLENLRSLDASGNKLSSIPASIAGCKEVIMVNISRNRLKVLPEEIRELKKCICFDCSENNLEAIPPAIGGMSGLKYLQCFLNKIKELPSEIVLVPLVELIAHDNCLESLPKHMAKLRTLRVVDIRDNHLESLSPILGIAISKLFFSGNPIAVHPQGIERLVLANTDVPMADYMRQRQRLCIPDLLKNEDFLSSCRLFGLVISQHVREESLLGVERANTTILKNVRSLIDSIIQSWPCLGQGMDIEKLLACPDQLFLFMKNAKLWIRLEFYRDLAQISRELPVVDQLKALTAWMSSSSPLEIRVIEVPRKKIYFIPEDIVVFKNLEGLSVSENIISLIPSCLSKLEKLVTIKAGRNRIVEIPEEFPSSIREILLDGNQLSTIPRSIGQLPHLEGLTVSGNRIQDLSFLEECASLKRLNIQKTLVSSLPKPLLERLVWLRADASIMHGFYEAQIEKMLPSIREEIPVQSILKNFSLDVSENLADVLERYFSHDLIALIRSANFHFGKEMRLKFPHWQNGEEVLGTTQSLHDFFRFLASLQRVEFFGPLALKGHPELLSVEEKDKEVSCWLEKQDMLMSVTTLDLQGKRILTIPPEATKLQGLKELSLKNTPIRRIPDVIGSLPNLETLDVSNSSCVSYTFLASCVNLRKFSCCGNKLTEVPEQVQALNKLREANFDDNNIAVLPDWLSNLKELETLTVQKNKLRGLPFAISALDRLRVLNVSQNKLQVFPKELTELTKLQQLYIQENQDIRHLSQDLWKMKGLQVLNCSHTGLSTLDGICDLINLERLIARENTISRIPFAIQHLRKLSLLDLSYNAIDDIPEELCRIETLSTLILRHNVVTRVPFTIGFLEKLCVFDFSENAITEVAGEIGNCKNLTTLLVNNNGSLVIGEWLSKLTSLKILDISGCAPLDKMPEYFSTFNALISFNASNLLIKEIKLPRTKSKLQCLILDGNQLTESRIRMIWVRTSLERLSFRRNKISWIPEHIENLQKLEELYLSGNPLDMGGRFENIVGKTLRKLEIDKHQYKKIKEKADALKQEMGEKGTVVIV
jgi:Leucine-rich repeat (LRR) protein